MTRAPEAQEGFRDAFPGLFIAAYRLALRLLGSPAEAEDVAAEAVARALVRWERIGDLPYREAWVARVATNLAIDQLRRRRAPQAAVEPGADPTDATALRLALGAALAALPRRQREVIALRYLVDLEEQDVARALGISINSVKKHASRGRAALRERLTLDWEVNLALD